MRFYNHPHAFYAGVDLHAISMFTHILDSKKALSMLEAKLGRAVYHVWSKQQAFDLRRFFA